MPGEPPTEPPPDIDVRGRLSTALPARARSLLDDLDPAEFPTLARLEAYWALPSSAFDSYFFETSALCRLVAGLDDKELRSTAYWAFLRRFGRVMEGRPRVPDLPNLITWIGERRLSWSPAELRRLWRIVAALRQTPEYHAHVTDFLTFTLGATEGLPKAELPAFADQLLSVRSDLWMRSEPDYPAFRKRVDRLLEAGGVPTADLRLGDILGDGDGFSAVLREEYLAAFRGAWMLALLEHWGATPARPNSTWLGGLRERVAAVAAEPGPGAPDVVELVREILGRLSAHRPQVIERTMIHQDRVDTWREQVYLEPGTTQLVRGMVWTLERADGDWVVPLLGAVAAAAGAPLSGAQPRAESVANSAVRVLGRRPEAEAAVAQLAKVRAKARKKTLLKTVATTLETIAARAGLTAEQLLERTVPTFGLGGPPPGSAREEPAGEFTAVLALDAAAVPALSFRGPDGKVRASAPKAVREGHPELLAELRTALKELRTALPAERFRIEGALTDGRVWPAAQWARRYLDHPLTGVYGRSLIWECSHDGGETWTAGLPAPTAGARAPELAGPAGEPVPLDAGALVRLWHPIRAAAGEVRAWRERLYALELRQPFKQAFREVYLLTPAETQTVVYSNRFAAHVLRYGQAKALVRSRGWTGPQLGFWDGGFEGAAVKELPGTASGERRRASFYVELAEIDGRTADGTPHYCATDQVRFERYEGRAWRVEPIADVPPLALSEVMRDIDLAVGVASIGTDPEWTDRGHHRHNDYWREYAFGAIGPTGETRRIALERLLPRTKIAERVEIAGRYLRVRGDLRTYKIHLGSANILMEPDDAYLCVVQARGAAPRVFLPFEDERLSVILSKAFLLAADAAITDESILLQIKRGT